MSMQSSARLSVANVWTPREPLPGREVLAAIAGHISRAWGLPQLSRKATICYNPRLKTTLGRAVFDDLRVELNARLLLEHPSELVPTLAHELAHLAVFMKYRKALPHGPEFRALMRTVGMPTAATHNLPTRHLCVRRRKYLYIHRCSDCGYSHVSRAVRRRGACAHCGSGVTWDIFRIPDTQAGRKIVAQMRRRQRRFRVHPSLTTRTGKLGGRRRRG
jgi:predicted SprT family Zn-dependent metalloprotease